ncbi:MAG: hypothetical protein Q4C95_03485 [Planctomycetia bacterium]|nr:hypothetical protein [Planctomycetia bacterium]
MKKKRILRLEYLEDRTLLSLNTGTLDWQTLVEQKCFDSTNNPIFVTTLQDVSDETDGLISLREAIDYAGTSTTQGTLGNQIQFDCFGKIELRGTALSITKNLTIDASGVSGITIDANESSRVFYLRSSSTEWISVSLNNLHLINGSPGNNDLSRNNGGAIYNGSLSRLTLSSCDISDNNAISGGAIYNLGTLTISNSSIHSNRSNQGGGINNASAGILTISGSKLENNIASSYAGGVLNAGTFYLNDSLIISNRASSTDGGGLYNIYSGFLTINSSQILNNIANNNGGGLYNSAGNGSLILSKTLIANNETISGSGGAVYNTEQGKISISASTFCNNSAFVDGGAIANLNYGMIDLIESVLSNNIAQTGSGGGIANETDSSMVLVDVDISNNISKYYGGGINNSGNIAVSSSILKQNRTGVQGGGFRNSGIVYWSNGSIESNGIITQETGSGGGIFNLGRFLLYNSFVNYNYIEGERGTGGGISNNSGVLTVKNSTFIENRINLVNAIGGGLFNSNEATANISTSVFFGNMVIAEGSALYNLGILTLSNSSVSYNIDQTGEGVYYDDSYSGSSYTVTKTTISDNIVYQDDFSDSETKLVLTDNNNLVDSAIDLGVISASQTPNMPETLVLTNTNSTILQLSSFSIVGNAADSFLFQFYRKDGSVINDATFQMDPNESITIKLSLKSNASFAQGANHLRFSWNVQDVLEDETLSSEIRIKKIDFEFVSGENKSTLTTEENVSVSLSGNSSSYSIKLNYQPTSTVFVYIQTDIGITPSKSLLTFNPTNWNVAQTVLITPDIEKLIQYSETDQILLRHEIITSDIQYLGTVIDSVSVDIQDYIVVQDSCSINLSDSFSDALWDLDNNGQYSAKDWVSSEELSENSESNEIFSVKKKEGDKIEEIPVKIEKVAPTFEAQLKESSNSSLIELDLKAFWNSASTINRWQIKWGDGSSQIISQNSSELRICHFYTQTGLFDISVEIVDSNELGLNHFYHIASHQVISTNASTASVSVDHSIQSSEVLQSQSQLEKEELISSSCSTTAATIKSDVPVNSVFSLEQSVALTLDQEGHFNFSDLFNNFYAENKVLFDEISESFSETADFSQDSIVFENELLKTFDLLWSSDSSWGSDDFMDSQELSESIAENSLHSELEIILSEYDSDFDFLKK